jgi:4-diphosphocytidyl-2-C-methyl-D-erythritol kinase
VTLTAFAPAKINLYLHVGPRAADGYHPLASLMVFADFGDHLSIEAADAVTVEIDGPFADALMDDSDDENLVMQAVRKVLSAASGPQPPFRLLLNKMLPVGAGLGGGSSDAGATFRLLRDALQLSIKDGALQAMAASLGADGAACLWGEPVIAEGRGEQLSPAPSLPPLHAVLVNPGVVCSTPAVFRAYDAAGAPGDAYVPALPAVIETVEEVAAYLTYCRNDLEAPAIQLHPEIGEVLEMLRAERETLIARMSGSGSTCFALCGSDIEAEGLIDRLQQMRPDWWIRSCRLGGPWPQR